MCRNPFQCILSQSSPSTPTEPPSQTQSSISAPQGVVVKRDGLVVKLPLNENISHPAEIEEFRTAIEQERDAYRRSAECDGIVPCIDLSGEGIIMRDLKDETSLIPRRST